MAKGYRFVKSVIRMLKRKRGQPVTLLRTTTAGTIDWTKGTETGRSVTTLKIKKAIIMPAKTLSKFAYDIGYLAANKNFTYGGVYGQSERDMIIDQDDLGDFVLDLHCRVRFSGSDYNIKQIESYEEANAKYLVISRIEGQTNES